VCAQIARAMGGRRITLRTLDVGADKPLPYLTTAAEANPFLGRRGIRLSLAHRELLRDQMVADLAGRRPPTRRRYRCCSGWVSGSSTCRRPPYLG
jgi:signal transduction protein with GAF and PtsI domain